MSDSTNGSPLDGVDTLLGMVAEYSLDLISVHSPGGEFQYVSPNVRQLFGWPADALIGHSPFEFFHPEDVAVQAPLGAQGEGVVRYRFRTGDGNFRWAETRYRSTPDGRHLVAVTRDVHREHAMLERLERSSVRDALTGLLNRRGLEEALEQEMERSRRSGEDLSLMFVDVDRFKQINDTEGHAAGDQVLRRIGSVIAAQGRLSDRAGRWGGDEFLVLLPATRSHQAVRAASRLARGLREGSRPVSVSVGISSSASAGTSGELIRQADEAQYAMKRQGGGRIGVYGCLEGRRGTISRSVGHPEAVLSQEPRGVAVRSVRTGAGARPLAG
jgi:diguanylate cyclase (GGDEF)-like protein/PAS domain S-box-containing protein